MYEVYWDGYMGVLGWVYEVYWDGCMRCTGMGVCYVVGWVYEVYWDGCMRCTGMDRVCYVLGWVYGCTGGYQLHCHMICFLKHYFCRNSRT